MQPRKEILNIRAFSACTIQKNNKINAYTKINLKT